jgi:putative ABC transport system substrate-binding protein
MRRREFIGLVGGAAVAWPLSVRAQPRKVPVVGILWHSASAEEEAAFSGPMKAGFAELGYVEGKTIIFEERYAAEQLERFDILAAELVGLRVDVVVAPAIPSALALQRLTSSIPIVMVANPDPVGLKLVSSLARPGGNITGLSSMAFDLATKRMQLISEAVPSLSRLALLVNPYNPFDADRQISEIQQTAEKLKLSLKVFEARSPDGINEAFGSIASGGFGAVMVTQNALYFSERKRIADHALANRLPIIGPANVFAEAGALISYGPNWPAIFRNTAGYVDKILKGEKPADLPVQQPTVFELVINLKTAKALGLTVPPTLLARADEVIE